MKIKQLFFLINFVLINSTIFGQETLPVYTDYLTDNIYLIHPAGAGISDYGKIRVTGRKQWIGYDKAPSLQTLSFHTHIGNESALGLVLYNDKNGHFSQIGGQLTFAYHLSFDYYDKRQLSFGLSAIVIQNTLDGSNFNVQDSDVNPVTLSSSYYNTDVGFAYRDKSFFSFYTIKNILLSKRELFDEQVESTNLRRHLVTLGYQFNKDDIESIKFQPSIMGQYIEQTQELFLDTNLKVFFPLEKGEIWGGLSYRKGFDNKSLESSNFITPFLGIKHKTFIASYSYSNQFNNSVYSKGGSHQITLGYNFDMPRYARKSTWDL